MQEWCNKDVIKDVAGVKCWTVAQRYINKCATKFWPNAELVSGIIPLYLLSVSLREEGHFEHIYCDYGLVLRPPASYFGI